MQAGQSQFSVWFELNYQQVGDYSIAVTVKDETTTFSGGSEAVHFDGKVQKQTNSENKESTNQTENKSQSSLTPENKVSPSTNTTNQTVNSGSNQNRVKASAPSQQKVSQAKTKAKPKDEQMLSDRDETQVETKKSFPWGVVGLLAVAGLALLALLAKVFLRK
ncbi:hypothetical protein ACVRY7_06420 [Streptococcus ictaluri]|uniref:Uncharacterized protein n=1 Tax=Streptococcus ictaluri 707-05 TaxID=764299 RepID=G5K526_9STRE|nr:hypothetical protein [Streptococcus ictaluri]EHI69081.1 hypothetical protein STRIC_1913 [Streptococcus ictaluri 707-05]